MEHKYSTYLLFSLFFIIFGIAVVSAGFENIRFCLTDDCNVGFAAENYDNKPVFLSENYLQQVLEGDVPDSFIITKFGANTALSTTWQPISISGVYQTPNSSMALEIVSTSNADNITGSGSQKVVIEGLNSSYDLKVVSVNMNGTSAVSIGNFTRVFRLYVNQSGTYATQSTGSHVGTITVRGLGGGSTWAEIPLINGFPIGQSLIGSYTIPQGYTGYLLAKHIDADAQKAVDTAFFRREGINIINNSYYPMRMANYHNELTGDLNIQFPAGQLKLPEYTDVVLMARGSAGSTVSVSFQLLLVQNEV